MPEDRRRISGHDSTKHGRKPVSEEDDKEQLALASCRFYVERPGHQDVLALSDDGPISRAFVLEAMRLAVKYAPEKQLSPRGIVKWVDFWLENGSSPTEAYKYVSDSTGKTPEAVRKAYQRAVPGVLR